MALTFHLKEGDGFFVGLPEGIVPLRVVNVTPAGNVNRFSVEVEGREYKITEELATEVLPDVRVSAGLASDSSQAVVLTEAPKSISIDRLYEVAKKKHDRNRA